MTARLPIEGLGEPVGAEPPVAEPAAALAEPHAADPAADPAAATNLPPVADEPALTSPPRKSAPARAKGGKRGRRTPVLVELVDPAAMLTDEASAGGAAGSSEPPDPESRPGPARLGELLPVPLVELDVERARRYQDQHGLLFGQAVVALSLASQADVDWALSQQYAYAWVRDGQSALDEGLVQAREPFGAVAETFRDLRAQLMAQPELAKRALAVVGVQPGDGRSFVAANLAIACSQAGARTLLVDADLRRPCQHALFGLPADDGLVGLLAGRRPRSVVRRVPQLPGLHLLGAGFRPPNPLELLQRPALAALLAEVVGSFDIVIVDTPAAAGVADARVIAAACGAALAVARKDHTPAAALQDLAGALARLHTHLAGVVFNPT